MASATVSSATMKTASAVKSTSAVGASAQTRLSARRHSSHSATMIKAAESAGVQTGLMTYRRWSVNCWRVLGASMKALTSMIQANRTMAKIRPAIVEASASAIERIVVEKRSAVGFKVAMIEKNVVVAPVRVPVVPSPAESAKEANTKTQAKPNSWPGKKQSRVVIPAWPDYYRRSIR